MKPSGYPTLSVLALAEVIAPCLHLTCCVLSPEAATSERALATHPGIDNVMFTGSSATGKAITRSSADMVKRPTLELGGNDAGIVPPDADVKSIAVALLGAFTGARPFAALKRLYVHEGLCDQV
jgi:phenylacetaldehyde dehydrogenase